MFVGLLFASLFETMIVKPIFNLLVLIYGILPGHNFGLSIILFTIVIRLLMWPLVKKQLHQAKAMRKLQPELKKIKKAATNKQQESVMLMELYKERGISPFGSIGTLIVQLIILIGLYSGLQRVVNNPQALIDNSYGFLRDLPWLKHLATDIKSFDATLFGVIDLSRAAINKGGGIYYPGLFIVLASAVAQYFQSSQLLPNSKDGRSLRSILKDAGSGKTADQSEVNAAVGRGTRYLLPFMIIIFTINLASALSLYWLTGGIVAFIQQARVLGKDEEEMEKLADKPDPSVAIEGEVITKSKAKKTSKNKRRKR